MQAYVLIEEYRGLIENVHVFTDKAMADKAYMKVMYNEGLFWCPETEEWYDEDGNETLCMYRNTWFHLFGADLITEEVSA
jgi:hypothetical protein